MINFPKIYNHYIKIQRMMILLRFADTGHSIISDKNKMKLELSLNKGTNSHFHLLY